MRAGSTAKATATAAGRGHIRGLGRPGVSSSHPAVLKSPAARVFGICMPNTRPHERLPKLGGRAGQTAWTSAGYAVSLGKLPRQHFLTARTTSTISWGFGVGFIGRPTNPLSPAATWLLNPTEYRCHLFSMSPRAHQPGPPSQGLDKAVLARADLKNLLSSACVSISMLLSSV